MGPGLHGFLMVQQRVLNNTSQRGYRSRRWLGSLELGDVYPWFVSEAGLIQV